MLHKKLTLDSVFLSSEYLHHLKWLHGHFSSLYDGGRARTLKHWDLLHTNYSTEFTAVKPETLDTHIDFTTNINCVTAVCGFHLLIPMRIQPPPFSQTATRNNSNRKQIKESVKCLSCVKCAQCHFNTFRCDTVGRQQSGCFLFFSGHIDEHTHAAECRYDKHLWHQASSQLVIRASSQMNAVVWMSHQLLSWQPCLSHACHMTRCTVNMPLSVFVELGVSQQLVCVGETRCRGTEHTGLLKKPRRLVTLNQPTVKSVILFHNSNKLTTALGGASQTKAWTPAELSAWR